ncbi:MAG: hypothetical protein EOL86_15455 [Deltaproteobacteria bacterium]|nr:hypothetical protein [Deltaproteobacteria bacterium]
MTRNRASAKKAGTAFETLVVGYLRNVLHDERIERRAKSGAKDRGDVSGLIHMGGRIVVECKNTTRTNLAGWATEAEVERGNDDAVAGIVVHKRHGKGQARDQWVTMTLADLVSILTGAREGVPF